MIRFFPIINLRSLNVSCLLSILMSISMGLLAPELKGQVFTDEFEQASGRELLEKVHNTHEQFPYVYEEQSMILIDRLGQKETRNLKRYSRVEQDGQASFLLVFDSPEDVKGVAVLARRNKLGETTQFIYLPAFSRSLIRNAGGASHSSFLVTDFSVENLIGEELDNYILERQRDSINGGVEDFVVDVRNNNRKLRRHYILKDILFIARTEFFDELDQIYKCQTQHDLTPVLGDMWRANMLLMQDFRENHQTLIKINKRVFSADYVPTKVFTAEWLYENTIQAVELEMQTEESS